MRFDVAPRAWSDPEENATATINYTSGTTARPKGVQMTHRNMWINAMTFGLHLRPWERDVFMHTLPTFHANGWGFPYLLAGAGAKQVVLRKVDGAEILRRVDEHGVTLMCGAPAVWNAVLDAAATWEGDVPGRGRVRIVVRRRPAADADDPAHRRGTGLGVHPDLRPDRDVADPDLQPDAAGRHRTPRPRTRTPSWDAPVRRRSACR